MTELEKTLYAALLDIGAAASLSASRCEFPDEAEPWEIIAKRAKDATDLVDAPLPAPPLSDV